MPTIVAICPYCRAGGVRAKDTAVGASATCPKCKSSFTLLPEEDLPDWAVKAQADAAVFSAPGPAKPKTPEVEETRAMAAMPDVTEPSPVLPADLKPAPKPAPVVAPTPAFSFAPPGDTGLLLALGALILVGPAVLATQLPFGRLVALGLAALGLVGGLLGLGGEGKARLAGSLAAAFHSVTFVVVLFLPSWLNLDPWRGGAPQREVAGAVAVENATNTLTPITPNDWLDASRGSWQSGDVRVTFRGAAIGPIELFGPNGAKRTTKELYLHLVLQVSNVGVERDVPLSEWATEETSGINVTDAGGKVLAPAAFEAGWAPARGRRFPRVSPGHTADIYLVFTAPAPKTAFVRARLSGSAVGSTEEIRFQVTPIALPSRGPNK